MLTNFYITHPKFNQITIMEYIIKVFIFLIEIFDSKLLHLLQAVILIILRQKTVCIGKKPFYMMESETLRSQTVYFAKHYEAKLCIPQQAQNRFVADSAAVIIYAVGKTQIASEIRKL